MKTWRIFAFIGAVLAYAPSTPADATDAIKSPKGYSSKGYVWNKMTPEQRAAMRMVGDPARGKETFRICRGCHKSSGEGRVDGTYPRLTGQHAVVIIKQVTDTRAGIRINPKMQPFSAEHAVSTQEIVDVAAFLERARSAAENGKGMGDAGRLARAKELYESRRCIRCHGENGEGDEKKVYPVVAAQHYGYLLREMEHIQEGVRGNSHPDMVKALKGVTHADLESLADFMSRMPDYRNTTAK